MKAVISTPGQKHRVGFADIALPTPQPGEALVRIEAFSINRGELALLKIRQRGWRPGQDIAGIVERAADNGRGPPAGARVTALIEGGGWAEFASVPVERMAVIPNETSIEEAAGLPMAGLTALGLIRRCGSLVGKSLVVTGANGGVGDLALQLGRLSGAIVIAIARRRVLRAPLEGSVGQLVSSMDELVGRHDFILESIGGTSLEQAIGHIEPSGKIILFGNSSGENSALDVFSFFGAENAAIETYFSYRAMVPDEIGRNLEFLLDLVARKLVTLGISTASDWKDLEGLLSEMTVPGKIGKIVGRITA